MINEMLKYPLEERISFIPARYLLALYHRSGTYYLRGYLRATLVVYIAGTGYFSVQGYTGMHIGIAAAGNINIGGFRHQVFSLKIAATGNTDPQLFAFAGKGHITAAGNTAFHMRGI